TVPAAREDQAEFRLVLPSDLTESATNPRRHADAKAFTDLVASVRTHGVLVPLLVRPGLNGRYEVVAGMRRYRAAKEAGVESIPVRIRDLTDTQALEIQVIENLQREDVHPLDEAIGYQALMDRAGYDVVGIAAKVGKSASYVYQRLKLAELIEPAKKAFLADEITAGHAILIARLQPADQKKVLGQAIDRYPDGIIQVDSVRTVARFIQDQILLDLHGAPWKKDDATLLPAAGPCTTCPKRTGNQPALFPEVKKGDTCTDPQCFAAKMAAHIERRAAALAAEGDGKVLRLSDDYAYSYDQEKELAKAGVLKRGEWVKAAAGSCAHATSAIVVHGDNRGQTLTVCAEKSCKEHWRRAGGGMDEYRSTREIAADKRRREEARRKTEVRNRVMAAVLDKVRAPLTLDQQRRVARAFLGHMWHDFRKRIAQRHGWEPVKERGTYHTAVDWEAPIKAHVAKAKPDELARFLMELMLTGDEGGYRSSNRDELAEA
ncbi:MAG: ParB/RepB/Spo0J family partition protein, partial [Solimonas sp.]